MKELKYHTRATEAIDILRRKHNFEAYIVGGAVRDLLMNKTPKDYDVTTNALPEQVKEVFKDYPIINNNGEKHGTITVMFDEEPIEITSYRLDGKYTDSRRPDNVTFSKSLREDLERRDFTINALALDTFSDEVIDYFGGVEDLKNKIICAVGNPLDRFDEDPLRILRGLRFASKLGFSIAMPTLMAMYEKKEKLALISMERIREELIGILCGEYALQVLLNPYAQLILAEVLPEIVPMFNFDQHNKYHKQQELVKTNYTIYIKI